MKDLYKILNISQNSTLDEIKAAYRKLAKEHHPDKGGNADYFCLLREAYDILSNSLSRGEYDRERNLRPFRGQPFRTVVPNVPRMSTDVFDDLFDVVTRKFGLNREYIHDVEIILSAREAVKGINLELRIPVERICDSCFGFGGTILKDCHNCRGKGIINVEEIAYLKVNQGVNNGDILIVKTPGFTIRALVKVEK